MPNIWTGKGNPYTRTEVLERLNDTLSKGEPIIVGGAGAGISAKFIEKGGADLIIIYASGKFRMAGHGSIAGMMAYGDANQIAMDLGEFEVLPVVEEIPVICGVHASDPRRRMWHFLPQVKEMGFSGINNFPTHSIIDGHFRQSLEETGMGVQKEVDCVAMARKMDMFTITYVATPEEAKKMAEQIVERGLCNVSEYYGTEVNIYYPGLYAGQTDLMCVHNGADTIVDFKQTNKPKQREWITDYFTQGAAYCMAHDTIYGTQIDKFVVMMCSADLYYQEFIIQGKELKEYKYLWLERLDKYHRNSYIDGRKDNI